MSAFTEVIDIRRDRTLEILDMPGRKGDPGEPGADGPAGADGADGIDGATTFAELTDDPRDNDDLAAYLDAKQATLTAPGDVPGLTAALAGKQDADPILTHLSALTLGTSGQAIVVNDTADGLEFGAGGGGGATTLADLTDVDLTGATDGDLLQKSGADFVARSMAEAGIAAATHPHAISDTTGLQAALDAKALATDLTSHTANTSNPHSVTAAQVGAVPTGRTLTITGPATIGGSSSADLSANRTLVLTKADASTDGYLDADDFALFADKPDYLSELLDVAIDTPAASHVLTWDEGDDVWLNRVLGIADIDGLTTALSGKASSSHSHGMADLTGFASSSPTTGQVLRYNGSAYANATLATSDVSGLVSALSGKQDSDAILTLLSALALGTAGQAIVVNATADGFEFDDMGGGGASALADLTDVIITAAASGDFLRHNGTDWVDAVISASDLPNHSAALLNSGTLDNARLDIVPVAKGGAGIDLSATGGTNQVLKQASSGGNISVGTIDLDFLSDVAISSPATAQVLRYNGSGFVNSALALDDLSDAAITTPATGHFLMYNGTNFVNVALSSGDLPSHVHSAADITSGTLAVARGGTGITSVTATEYGYVAGATSNLQTQISGKLSAPSATTNNLTRWNGSAFVDSCLLDNGTVLASTRALKFTATNLPASTEYGIGITSGTGMVYQVPATTIHRFYDGSNEILRIGGSGSDPVLKGPQGKLNFDGTYLKFTGTTSLPSTSEYGIGYSSSTGLVHQVASGYIHRFYTHSVECMRIGDGGNSPFVAFGAGFSPTAPVHARATSGAQIRADYSSGLGLSITVNASGNATVTCDGYTLNLNATVQTLEYLRLAAGFAPASGTSFGLSGFIVWDTSYLYICTASNVWKRVALSSF